MFEHEWDHLFLIKHNSLLSYIIINIIKLFSKWKVNLMNEKRAVHVKLLRHDSWESHDYYIYYSLRGESFNEKVPQKKINAS